MLIKNRVIIHKTLRKKTKEKADKGSVALIGSLCNKCELHYLFIIHSCIGEVL